MEKKERNTELDIQSYLVYTARKLHNCLYMYEESNDTAYRAIHSITIQIRGLTYDFPLLNKLNSYISLISTLEELYDEFIIMDSNHEVVKREIFKCMNLCNTIKEEFNLESDHE